MVDGRPFAASMLLSMPCLTHHAGCVPRHALLNVECLADARWAIAECAGGSHDARGTSEWDFWLCDGMRDAAAPVDQRLLRATGMTMANYTCRIEQLVQRAMDVVRERIGTWEGSPVAVFRPGLFSSG